MPQQQPAIPASTQDINARLSDLRAKAGDLRLRMSDLEVRKNQLGEQRRSLAADASPAQINKQLADVEHELAATRIQHEQLAVRIEDLTTERDFARAFMIPPGGPAAGVATTAPPPPDPYDVWTSNDRLAGMGAFVLMIPIVVALTRRIWVRGTIRRTVDIDDSPRLQRMEQAIESIAVEVERIGEAQRFTTKLLAERQQPEPLPRVPAAKKEPGVITPH